MFRTIFITMLCTASFIEPASAQSGSPATDTGSKFIAGALSFTNQGGDLYSFGSSDRLTTFFVGPRVFFFAAPRLGIGGNADLTFLSQSGSSFTTLSIGPQIGYFFDRGQTSIPFINGGVNWVNLSSSGSSDASGYSARVGGGTAHRMDHLAITFGVEFIYEKIENTAGNTLLVTLGLGGFLY